MTDTEFTKVIDPSSHDSTELNIRMAYENGRHDERIKIARNLMVCDFEMFERYYIISKSTGLIRDEVEKISEEKDLPLELFRQYEDK